MDVSAVSENFKCYPRVFLIGPRGAGKSATINTIIGKNVAESRNALRPESTTKELRCYLVENQNRILVDSPALRNNVLNELKREFKLAQSDVLAFVISAQRLQMEELSCIEMFLKDMKTFHPRSFLVFTRGNNLKNKSNIFDPEQSPELYNLYEAVGKKWVVFENRNQTAQDNVHSIEKFWSISNEVGSVAIQLSEEIKQSSFEVVEHSAGLRNLLEVSGRLALCRFLRAQIGTNFVSYSGSLSGFKVFLIGPRGAGKSATVNTIIGKNVAQSEIGLESTAKKLRRYPVENQNSVLIDTPTLGKSVLRELKREFNFAKSDVIAFVISVQKLQMEEVACIDMFLGDLKMFHNRSFIVLTRGSDLKENSYLFDIEHSRELCKLYEAVGNRYVVFENSNQTTQENAHRIDKFWCISHEISSEGNYKGALGHSKKLLVGVLGTLTLFSLSRKLPHIADGLVGHSGIFDVSFHLYSMSSWNYFQNVPFYGLACFFVDLLSWTM